MKRQGIPNILTLKIKLKFISITMVHHSDNIFFIQCPDVNPTRLAKRRLGVVIARLAPFLVVWFHCVAPNTCL